MASQPCKRIEKNYVLLSAYIFFVSSIFELKSDSMSIPSQDGFLHKYINGMSIAVFGYL